MLAALTAILLSAAHPSLFFTATDVPALRTKAQSTHATIANHITQILSPHLNDAPFTTSLYASDPRFYGGHVMAMAFGYQLTGNPAYAAQAKTQLFQLMSWTDWGFGEGTADLNRAHNLLGATMAYDWIYETLTATERSQVEARIATEAETFYEAIGVAWWTAEYLQNHHWIDTAALGLAGLALQGEDARAPTWLAEAKKQLGYIQLSLDPISDGSWHEGSPYLVYGLSHALPFWMALARTGDDRTNLGLLRGFGRHRLATAVPDAPRTQLIPHGDFTGWPSQGTVEVLRFAAAKFHDGLAEAHAQQWLAAGTRSSFLPELWYEAFEFLAYDPSVAATPKSQWPLDAAFSDQQSAVLKSSLDTYDLQVGFKAGPFGGRSGFDRIGAGIAPGGHLAWGHDHNDDLSFWIYGLGQWLAPESEGYTAGKNVGVTNPANVTAYHNGLLIDGTGQMGDVRSSDSEWNNPWFWTRDARTLVPLLATDDYSATGGRGETLFASTLGMTRWDRLVVLARHRYVVVRDDLASTATHAYQWLCHFSDGVSPDSATGWITGTAKNSKRLAVRMVAPASWTATTATQTASLMSKFDSDATTSVVTVQPTVSAANQQFLAVLFPQDVGAARTQTDPLTADDPGAGTVVQGALTERWIFARAGGDGKAAADLALTSALAGMEALDSTGEPTRALILAGPGKLSDQSGARELLSSTTALSIEADLRGTTLAISGQNILDFHTFAPASVTTLLLNGRQVNFLRQGNTLIFPSGPAGEPDAGPSPDAGTGVADAGTSSDAGTPSGDAGTPSPDAGSSASDAGSDGGTAANDAGTRTDGGPDAGSSSPDAGPVARGDAGSAPAPSDSGSSGDAGTPASTQATSTEPPVAVSGLSQGCGGCSGGFDLGFAALGLVALARRRSGRRNLPPARPLC